MHTDKKRDTEAAEKLRVGTRPALEIIFQESILKNSECGRMRDKKMFETVARHVLKLNTITKDLTLALL